MKTDTETLRKRGFLTNTEAEPYFYIQRGVIRTIKDKTAVIVLRRYLFLEALLTLMSLMKSYLECWLKKKPYILN